MAILTKYVSVTFTGGSNDGSAANPYTTIEAARDDINGTSDAGPHYIILSESSAAQTVYAASYGMPSGFEQGLWVGDYDTGVIVSGAHGQDITIDGGGVENKSAFVMYGSGSGIHNLKIGNIGTHALIHVGAIKGNTRPYSIRGVVITSSLCGGITGLGSSAETGNSGQDAWTIVDSCRIHLPNIGKYGISFADDSRNALINNCLIIFSGSAAASSTRAIYAAAGGVDRATASFCTFIARIATHNHTDSILGITVPRVENCIVSMSLDSDANLNFPFISADNVANNLYAGFRTSIVTSGVRRAFDLSSASFDASALTYQNTDPDTLTLFNDPDTTFKNIFADWTLASGAPAVDAGTTTNYFGLTLVDLSGTVRADSDAGTGGATDIGAFELISLGYGNTVIGVVAGSLGKIIDVARADITKVIGVE